jgi:signal transduction histidine kinase/ActR/RegA family two-component response regulator
MPDVPKNAAIPVPPGSVPDSEETMQFRQIIADLLAHVDQEAGKLRERTADLLMQLGALSDVTESKNALEAVVLQLREANQNLVIATFGAQDLQAKAESDNHRQEEFLSMLAHELRNPLAPIAMAADLIGKIKDAHPQLPKLQGIIVRQASHMSHLVDDLLDASRISTGKITLKKRTLRLSEIIDAAVETSRPFIDQRRQNLQIELPPELIAIDGDLVRLAQVFSNLLINATKFTRAGGNIFVTASKVPSAIAVTVRDDGVGIAPDAQAFIFDLFSQGPLLLDRAQGGLGIGLSLVRTIVEMHGGNVSVRSEGLDMGSEFIVLLPTTGELPAPESNSVAKSAAACRRRILIIEDNADANESLNDFLSMEGHIVTSAFDGSSGLAMARDNVYDVIVCDIGLPGIDGYELGGQLLADPSKKLPLLIALSGYDTMESRIKAAAAGFSHYLVKPVAIDMLMGIISSLPAEAGPD